MISGPNGGGLPIIGQLTPLSRAVLLAALGLSVIAMALHWVVQADPTLVFFVAAVAILVLAWVVGLATERLGGIVGPQAGGILNATMGNIAELIIAFFALRAGLLDVVRASLVGSIVGNLLLVLGASLVVGGLRHGTQRFDARVAGSTAALLVLAAVGMLVPAIFAITAPAIAGQRVQDQSVIVAVVLIVGYGLSLVWQATNPDRRLGGRPVDAEEEILAWSGRTAVLVLVVAAGLLAVISEILVSTIEPVVSTLGLSTFFVGVVLVPTIGNLAEQLVAIRLAAKNKIEFAMAVSYGASLQVALFVAPVLIIVAALIGQPLTLVFTPLEVVAVGAAVGISALVALDGESNWLEGALLVLIYLILAGSFFELPG